MTLILQQFEESLFIGRKAIRFQSDQLGEIIRCTGEACVHVASIHWPLSFEIGKACFYFFLTIGDFIFDLTDFCVESSLNSCCYLVEVFEPDHV